MDTEFPEILRDSLWHTTHPDNYELIVTSGFILPNPNIAESSRWKTSRGPEYYPYVRHIGGVSLFEFIDFNPSEYDKACPMSSWRTFIPFRKDWGRSVWIEIDRSKVKDTFVSPSELAKRQRTEEAERHTLMPRIEAAVLASIPKSAFKRVLLRTAAHAAFYRIDTTTNSGAA